MKPRVYSRRAMPSTTRRRDAAPRVAVVPPFQSSLPAMTFGQLRTLTRAGTPPGATIRQVSGGYVVELDVGPRRWILISTHRKQPRLFHRLDGAANAMRQIGAQPVHLQLDGGEAAPPLPSPPQELTPCKSRSKSPTKTRS